jgi:hypothetical protein
VGLASQPQGGFFSTLGALAGSRQRETTSGKPSVVSFRTGSFRQNVKSNGRELHIHTAVLDLTDRVACSLGSEGLGRKSVPVFKEPR